MTAEESVWSRGSSWSRPALVMVVYLGLGAAALGWGSLRGQPNVWHLAGPRPGRGYRNSRAAWRLGC